MCFAPQRCALFRRRNVQKWSEPLVFCAFSLRNVLRATTVCTFSTSQLPKVVRQWCVLCILTSKCASRHNGVHFFDISTSKSGPTLRCFVHFDLEMCFAPQRRAIFHLSSGQLAPHPPLYEPTFRPSGATNHWKKHSVSRLSYLFAHLHLLSSDSFSSTLLSSNLSLLSASALLCFSSVHIVGSLTSKLPSIKQREKDGMKVYSNTLWECCGILWDYRDFTSKCHGFPAGDMGEMVVHLYTHPQKRWTNCSAYGTTMDMIPRRWSS